MKNDLLTNYATHCGVALKDLPSFPANYFPIPEKYITIHAGSGMESKNYDYYSEVTNLLRQYLGNEIRFIQIGGKEEKPVDQCLQYNGITTLRQCAYIVKNSILHIGNDSIWTHYAATNSIPVVSLYGPTLSNVCGPTFHGKVKLLESDRKGMRPTHSVFEKDKTINFIKPEEVVNSVLELLGINKKVQIETLYIGKNFHQEVVEIIPDQYFPQNTFKNQILNIRMDYYFNEDFLSRILHLYKSTIFTRKPINIGLLNYFKAKINNVIYILDDKADIHFVKQLNYNGIPYRLFAEKNIDKYRIDLFDFNPVEEYIKLKRDEQFSNITSKTKFKSNKFIISKGKLYLSPFHWRNGKNTDITLNNTLEIGEALNDEEFWEHHNHYYLFNTL